MVSDVLRTSESGERARFEVEIVQSGCVRDFFGFNRTKNAIVEAAILATRTHLLPWEEIESAYRKLSVLVEETGGAQERTAFELLSLHVRKSEPRR